MQNNTKRILLSLLLSFRLLALDEQNLTSEDILATSFQEIKEEIPVKDSMTQQLNDEYENYYKLCRDNYSETVFDQFAHLLINELNKSYSPILYNMVKEIADKLEIATPEILICKGELANAFALQVSSASAGQIIIGKDLIKDAEFGLSYDELKAIIAHELAHLKHQHCPKRIKKVLTVYLPLIAINLIIYKMINKHAPDLYKHFNIKDYSVKVLGKEVPYLTKFNLFNHITNQTVNNIISLPAVMYLMKFYRTQEKEADLTSVNITKNPTALISALDKLYKMNNRTKNISSMILNNIPNFLQSHPDKKTREEYLKNAVIA